jgi:hypothetical protein
MIYIYTGWLLKALVCRHNPKFSYLFSTTLVTPHKINNFAHNIVSPSTTTSHLLSTLLLPLNKLKHCVTWKKASQKSQIHVKPTTYFRKQCTGISRIEGEYDLAIWQQWCPQRYPKSPIVVFSNDIRAVSVIFNMLYSSRLQTQIHNQYSEYKQVLFTKTSNKKLRLW